MGINSTEVSYGFGQLGSVFNDGTAAIKPPTNKVFVAITMLADTTFDSSGGLVSETFLAKVGTGSTTVGDTEYNYITTEAAAHDQTAGNASVEKGETGLQIDISNTFPKGVTIYGRWTEIDLASGTIIAYIGD